jgi:CheY-like chemotaxis protein
MALVVHELVTNSSKYGGLSDGGTVNVSWSRASNGDLLIGWRESGGPKVKPPTRKGFGSTIIDRSIPYDLGGEARIDYRPDGVEAAFRIPAKHVSEAKDHSGPSIRLKRATADAPAAPPAQVVHGKLVLMVEDSLIIALDAEDILKRLGAADVMTAGTVEHALEAIDKSKPDLALLDINLGDQTSFAIADRLHHLGIPFLFATGYGEQAQLPKDHQARTVVQKPYTLENVARALPKLIDGHERGCLMPMLLAGVAVRRLLRGRAQAVVDGLDELVRLDEAVGHPVASGRR